jgi:Zn-finger nucleic acid-binding protein
MKSISCPKCGNDLETITYQDITIDRCCRCAGIWFDFLEVELLKILPGSESLDLGNPDLDSHLNRMQKPIKCPRCKCNMTRMVDIDQYTIWYEKCPQCHGVWLDAGEFKRYKQNFRSQGIKSILKFPAP